MDRLLRLNAWLILGAGLIFLSGLGLFFYGYAGPSCDIAYIKLHGYLITYAPVSSSTSPDAITDWTASEDVVSSIRAASADPGVKAILLEVDSGGGSPIAGEEIQAALKASPKPTLALIREMGDSASYLAASGAGTIFASTLSDVGDIGITESYTDNAVANQQQGITYNQLSIGKYKDMFSTDKPLTPDERAYALKELQLAYDRIVALVAENRHLATSTVYALASGNGYSGQEALDNGLVDQLGNDADAETYLAGLTHLNNPQVCEY